MAAEGSMAFDVTVRQASAWRQIPFRRPGAVLRAIADYRANSEENVPDWASGWFIEARRR
jgi:hypothetical protein